MIYTLNQLLEKDLNNKDAISINDIVVSILNEKNIKYARRTIYKQLNDKRKKQFFKKMKPKLKQNHKEYKYFEFMEDLKFLIRREKSLFNDETFPSNLYEEIIQDCSLYKSIAYNVSIKKYQFIIEGLINTLFKYYNKEYSYYEKIPYENKKQDRLRNTDQQIINDYENLLFKIYKKYLYRKVIQKDGITNLNMRADTPNEIQEHLRFLNNMKYELQQKDHKRYKFKITKPTKKIIENYFLNLNKTYNLNLSVNYNIKEYLKIF